MKRIYCGAKNEKCLLCFFVVTNENMFKVLWFYIYKMLKSLVHSSNVREVKFCDWVIEYSTNFVLEIFSFLVLERFFCAAMAWLFHSVYEFYTRGKLIFMWESFRNTKNVFLTSSSGVMLCVIFKTMHRYFSCKVMFCTVL